MSENIAVIGLGYVGLPVALAFARKFPGTIGFDIDQQRVSRLSEGVDSFGETSTEALSAADIKFTSDPNELSGRNFFVIAVPTPIDENHRPNLQPLSKATEMVGKVLAPGSIIVYESTVYPGVTEEFCGPILEKVSGYVQGVDFKLAYSPERINPGDTEHVLEKIVKVVSGEDLETLEKVSEVYGTIIDAGVFQASSIKVAEAAKVIENTQRDLNIALMNELAIIFDRLSIRTHDVLEAASTKWNFLRFSPGLVGGHCIGVDPYYLTTRSEQVGYHPQVILAGRRINDNMGQYIAQRLVKLMVNAKMQIKGSQVGILGLTFKENVADLRNSRVPDIVSELKEFGAVPLVHDSKADVVLAKEEYNVELKSWEQLEQLDGLVIAVWHDEYAQKAVEMLTDKVKKGGVVIDIKSALNPNNIRKDLTYWSL